MTLIEDVKKNVTPGDAAGRYGLTPDRHGMCRCVFHRDKSPSMKLYPDHYHCFGCGAHGDVIDLTAKILDLPVYEAAKKLKEDFKGQKETVRGIGEGNWFTVLADYLFTLEKWKKDCAPKTPEEPVDPRYEEACRNEPYLQYLLKGDPLWDREEHKRRVEEWDKERKDPAGV